MSATIPAILEFAVKDFSVSEKELTVEETKIDKLPDSFSVFYVEKNGSYGNRFHRYVVKDGEVFSSAEREGMERLLKKEDYLRKKHLNAVQLVIIYRLLKRDMPDTNVVLSEHIEKTSMQEGEKDTVEPPSIEETPVGIRVNFWIKDFQTGTFEKHRFTISANFSITEDS